MFTNTLNLFVLLSVSDEETSFISLTPCHSGKEGDGAKEGKRSGVHPGPVLASQDPELVYKQASNHPAIDATDEEHGDDHAAGYGSSGSPAGHHEVDDKHGGHGGVAELLVGVLGEEVVDRLLSRAEEQGGRLAVGPLSVEDGAVAPDRGVGVAAGVGDQVDLVAGEGLSSRLQRLFYLWRGKIS
jgi:hypothetical protein